MINSVSLYHSLTTIQQVHFLSLAGWNSEFSFSTGCYNRVKELSLPDNLPIVEEGIVEFIPFPKVLALYEIYIYIYISSDANK